MRSGLDYIMPNISKYIGALDHSSAGDSLMQNWICMALHGFAYTWAPQELKTCSTSAASADVLFSFFPCQIIKSDEKCHLDQDHPIGEASTRLGL